MSCLFDKSIIQKYADDTIDPLELVFLKEHINYCAECRKEIELTMALEHKLGEFFVDDPGTNKLELMIEDLVEDCMYELNSREKLKYVLRRYIRLGRGIRHNSIRFVGYVPCTKRVGNHARKTAKGAGSALKDILKKKALSLLDDFI